jgi:hypothetical protein
VNPDPDSGIFLNPVLDSDPGSLKRKFKKNLLLKLMLLHKKNSQRTSKLQELLILQPFFPLYWGPLWAYGLLGYESGSTVPIDYGSNPDSRLDPDPYLKLCAQPFNRSSAITFLWVFFPAAYLFLHQSVFHFSDRRELILFSGNHLEKPAKRKYVFPTGR